MLDKLFKKSIILSFSQALSSLLSYTFILIIARYFGAEFFGKFIFSYSLIILLSYISDFGLSTLIIREISKEKNKALQIFLHSLVIRLCLSMIIYIGLLISLNTLIIIEPDKKILILLLGLLLLTRSFIELLLSYFLGKEEQPTYGLLQFLNSLVLVIIAYIFIEFKFNFILISSSAVIASVSSIVIGYFMLLKKVSQNISFSITIIRDLLKKMIPFGLTMLLTVFCTKIGIFMLAATTTDNNVGQFGAVYRLIEGFLFFPIVLTKMVYPIFSNLNSNKKNIEFLVNYSIKILILIASLIIIFCFLYSTDIITFLYSPSFSDSYILLNVMLWTLFAYFPNYILGHTLLSLHKQNDVLFVTILNLILNILFNYYLIQSFGLLGAAYAALICALFPFIGYIICLRNKINTVYIQITLLKSLFITIIIIIIGLLLQNIIAVIPLIMLLFSLYLISNYLLRILDSDDFIRIKELIK